MSSHATIAPKPYLLPKDYRVAGARISWEVAIWNQQQWGRWSGLEARNSIYEVADRIYPCKQLQQVTTKSSARYSGNCGGTVGVKPKRKR
jgi:hypothetical protein